MKYIRLLLVILIFQQCVPITPTSSNQSVKITYDNKDYAEQVGMTRLYPINANQQAVLEYPVISTRDQGLTLELDLLDENYEYISARYIHCNANWKPSGLSDLQFLSQYNEFPIRDYEYSSNTRIPYVAYSTQLPAPKISGNYLLIVYRDGNQNDLILTRRFLVFDQRAQVTAQLAQSNMVSQRNTHQQVDFQIKYDRINSINPLQEFQAVVMQNHQWRTALYELQPTVARADQNYLEYNHFSGENNFAGGNEFRFFDLRSVDFRQINISNINKAEDRIRAFIGLDKSRKPLAYSEVNQDFNGQYYLQNTDPGDQPMQSEYVELFFELETEKIDGQVFIGGMHNWWQLNKENQLSYDEERDSYRGSLLLRQGYYNYQYWVESPYVPAYELEGSHWQAENDYEILVYYRNPSNNFDELVGYRKISGFNQF